MASKVQNDLAKQKIGANDDLIAYIVVKKLLAPINSSPAYRMGLVDLAGRTIKEPGTDAEHAALTGLDRLIYKMRRIMAGRINVLYEFIYTRSLGDAAYKNATFGMTFKNRPEIKRVSKQLKRSKINESKEIDPKILLDKINTLLKGQAL